MIEIFQSMIQKKAQEFYNLRHSIASYTVKTLRGLRPEVQPLTLLYTIFDRKESLRSVGEGFWKLVEKSWLRP